MNRALLTLALTFFIDQLHKYYMLFVYHITDKGVVTITPFFDLVMVWNKGISYGLFQQDSAYGQYALAAFKIIAGIALTIWMFRVKSKFEAHAIALIAGGAFANAADRLLYGAVADFFSLHAFGFYWYVFNLADVAIVAGVIMLFYHSYKYPTKTP
jgi:signal peptidase II